MREQNVKSTSRVLVITQLKDVSFEVVSQRKGPLSWKVLDRSLMNRSK